MIQPWPKKGSKPLGDFRVFSLRSDLRVDPRNGQEHDFFVIDSPTWVNVIAVTPRDELVMIEQFRHGSATVELEIPGGVMDPEDASPEFAGERELREETGYTGENARIIGTVFPNPAIMSNTCHTILVENCRITHDLEWDHSEDIETRLVPVAEVPGLVSAGKVKHSLVVAALYCFDLLRRGLKA